MAKYLEGLNEKQKEAVLHTDGPLLILAGAGAGKTKTITHRILHLMADGVAGENILAVTFTNKAASEMRERVAHLLANFYKDEPTRSKTTIPFLSTFHSLGVRIIKENSTLLGLPRHFSIFDRDDSKRAVREGMKELGIDSKQVEPGKILGLISNEKGKMVTAQSYQAKVRNEYFPRIAADVWVRYEKILAREKALDFDDLLLKTAKLLEENETIRTHYQNLWKYIHIDEYQDTNTVQYKICGFLTGKHQNICVVGDIDQNIYSWRGANIQNIINFEKDYKDAKVILLEENYRSTQTILTAANRIIAKNVMRREKNLFTRNNEGEKIGLYGAFDEGDEANFVAHRASELIKEGAVPSDIAVLYRANFQSRSLEEAFLSHDVPYQLLGTRFFERKEVKDILSFIRSALNPQSVSDLERIINIPPRGIGKVTLQKITSGKENELSPAMRAKISDFREILSKIDAATKEQRPSALIKFIIKTTGIEDSLRKDEEGEERLENIGELATLATKYDGLPAEEGIEKLLEDAALAADQDSLMENRTGVKLMTVHASKGLEFDYVFITGLEENLFPHKRLSEAAISLEQSEEERRLFYVALTRARKKIYLAYASMRTIFGSKQVNIPSEFITDIDDELIERADDKRDPGGFTGKVVYLD